MMENGEYKDLQIGSENVYHILEQKAEEDEDKAAPYEVPVLTKQNLDSVMRKLVENKHRIAALANKQLFDNLQNYRITSLDTGNT